MHLLKHFNELTLHPKNAQELKGLILQLAIQGKLTGKWREENPNIQNASSLLKQIQKEKELLIKDKKIKKDKPLPSIIYDEIPYELPKEWIWCRLGHTGYTQTGSTPPTKDHKNFGNFIPFIGPAHISNLMMKYPEEGLSELGLSIGRLISQNSLMMVCIGGSIGKCNVNEIDVSCNQQINTVTPISIPVIYVKTVCQSPYFQKFVINKSSGSATPIINKGKWEMIPFPLPPLEEQKAIVEVVETLFKEVEQLEQLTVERIKLKEKFVISALNQLTTSNTKKEWAFLQEYFPVFFDKKNNIKKLRETVLQLAVQGKLTTDWRANNPNIEDATVLLKRIQKEKAQLIKDKKIKREKPLPPITKDEIPYVLPKGWVWCQLQDLEYLLGDGIHGTPEYSENGDYHFINGNNLTDGAIEIKSSTKTVSKDEFLKHKRNLNDRTILVSINGTIGNTAFYNNEKVMLGKSACYFNLFTSVDKYYIRQLLKSKYFLDYAFESATGTTIKNVSLFTMRSFIIPLPPFEEQKAIVEKVNALMGLCDVLEKEVKQSQEQSEKLMQSALREVFETNNSL